MFASPTRNAARNENKVSGGGGGRKGSTSISSSSTLMVMQQQPPPVQRSASFNASSTVPLKITVIDDGMCPSVNKAKSSYCVKSSRSLSNCSLISKIVNGKGDCSRNVVVAQIVQPENGRVVDGGLVGAIGGQSFLGSPLTGNGDKFKDYYV